jgi:hypothetical protein
MAGRDRMTIEEVVGQVLRDEHGDVIREFLSRLKDLSSPQLSGALGDRPG